MRQLILRTLLLLVVAASTAFAQKRGDRNLISRTDLDEGGSGLITAQDAIQRLRPNWLRPPMGRTATAGMLDGLGDRGSAPKEAILYIDEVRQPNLEQLRTVQASKIIEMKYLDQNRAVQMLGPGHEAGAILIVTVNKR